MSINDLLPDPFKVSKNDTDTIFDLRRINMHYKFGRITATEAMEQMDERLNKNEENNEKMYQAFHDELRKGDKNND